jgi:indole-3-acetate monooxygenase
MVNTSFADEAFANNLIRLRELAIEADQRQSLTEEQVALVHREGWLSMLVPKRFGGAEMPFPDAIRLQEALAAADGSLAWLITLCAGAGWFGGLWSEEVGREIFSTPGVCLAGSGAPSGIADMDDNGYRLRGRWDWATGADIATHFTLNARIHKHGAAVTDDNGQPRIRAFVVPVRTAKIIPNWGAIGMTSSSTHSFEIDDIHVSSNYAFDISPDAAIDSGPLYQFPFLPMALATFGANLCGMAGHFLELAAAVIKKRNYPLGGCALGELPEIQAKLKQATDDLELARTRLYELTDRSWDLVYRDKSNEVSDEAFLSTIRFIAETARQSVDSLYPLCGMQAADRGSEINLVWRDFHTATQHSLLLP